MSLPLDPQVLAFALAAGMLTIAPGPDTMLVVRNVLRGGRLDGILTSLGICSGLFAHATLSALGVSVLLVHSAGAFRTLKLAGAAYLVWLGVSSIRAALRRGSSSEPVHEPVVTRRRSAPRRCLVEGFLSNVLNPKTAMFYLAFLPQFIAPDQPPFARSLLLAGIHYAEGVLWLVGIACLVDRAQLTLLRPLVRRALDATCGALLVGFGARLALDRS